MADTVFHKIIAGEIPSKKEYEDDQCIVIHDIAPKAPVHVLVIPKRYIEHVGVSIPNDEALLGHLVYVAGEVARKLGIGNAFRLTINNGSDGGQVIPYLHVHVVGGWKDKSHHEV